MGTKTTFITALKAEHIKKKGTGIYVLGAILAAIGPVLGVTFQLIGNIEKRETAVPFNLFEKFTSDFLPAFTGFFFPLAIIIAVARIAQLDHRNGGWQLMELQPIKKWQIFFAKFAVIGLHNLIAIASAIGFSLLFAWITTWFNESPKSADMNLPLAFIGQLVLRLFTASLFLSALVYLVAVMLSSFIWSIVIGFFGLMISSVLRDFFVSLDWDPFTILSRVGKHADGSQLGKVFLFTEWMALVAAVFLCVVGFRWYSQKRFGRAFVKRNSWAGSVAVLAVFGVLVAFLLRPTEYGSYGKTVLSGEIASDNKYSKGFLIDRFTTDTVASFPVENGKFHVNIKKELPLSSYQLNLTGGNPVPFIVVMASNDSIFCELKAYGMEKSSVIKGTRLAENQTSLRDANTWSYSEFMVNETEYLEMPDEVIGQLYKDWKSKYKEASGFKTRDGYAPKADFRALDEKLQTIHFLNMWNDYSAKRKAIGLRLASEPKEIAEMRSKVSLRDATLLGSADYMTYLGHELTKTDTSDIAESDKKLCGLRKLPSGDFRDRALLVNSGNRWKRPNHRMNARR